MGRDGESSRMGKRCRREGRLEGEGWGIGTGYDRGAEWNVKRKGQYLKITARLGRRNVSESVQFGRLLQMWSS